MTEDERRRRKYEEAVRSYLRITGPVFCSVQELTFSEHVDGQYRKGIVAAADEGKPIPRKLTPLERAAFRAKARDYIKQFKAWAANPSKEPVPKWRG